MIALLEAGADPGARDEDGWTPLTMLPHAGVITALLEAGADGHGTRMAGPRSISSRRNHR